MIAIVFLNSARVDFDEKLDFAPFQALGSFTDYAESSEEDILERMNGQHVVITKEIPLSGELIMQFPSTVKLICEAGTGYNNIDLEAARRKGIAVCNIPGYSTEAVAQLVITFMLNQSASMIPQQKMLEHHDFTNFTHHLQVPHHEIHHCRHDCRPSASPSSHHRQERYSPGRSSECGGGPRMPGQAPHRPSRFSGCWR